MDRLSALETESVRSGRSDRTDLRSVRSVPAHNHAFHHQAATYSQYVNNVNGPIAHTGSNYARGVAYRSQSSTMQPPGYSPAMNHRTAPRTLQQVPSLLPIPSSHAQPQAAGHSYFHQPMPPQPPPPLFLNHHQNHQLAKAHLRGGTMSADERVQLSSVAKYAEADVSLPVHMSLPAGDMAWDNATAVTSETGHSVEDLQQFAIGVETPVESTAGADCVRYIGIAFSILLALLAYASPVVMVVLPRFDIDGWTTNQCPAECEGLLISFGFKLLILLVATWALFLRRARSTTPRVFLFRTFILFLTFLVTFAFWLFYVVRIWQRRLSNYATIVQFADSLVNALLFLHYLAVILLELRQLQTCYTLTVVRSPDGQTRHYSVGQLSVQHTAVFVLEQYYRDFPSYNPYLELAFSRRSQKPQQSVFKFYDVDGVPPNAPTGMNSTCGSTVGAGPMGVLGSQTPQSRARSALGSNLQRSKIVSANDRFYWEEDWERRVRRRKARLYSSADEAFSHIRRLQFEKGPAIPMDAVEAAQAVFPTLARSLQKYLRITRQQPKYTLDSILEHLALCICNDMGSKAFVAKYLSQGPVIQSDKEYKRSQNWVLVSDVFVSRAIQDGSVFRLRQGDVSLLVTVRRTPHFNLTEEVVDPSQHKFVLRLQSETSV